MVVALLLWLAMLFVVEVVLGSHTDVFHAEIGLTAPCEQRVRLPARCFFAEFLPALLAVMLPLLLVAYWTRP